MSKLNLAYRVLRFGSHLYGLADTTSERLSLTMFLLKFGLVRVAPRLMTQEDTELLLRDTCYIMGAHTTEVFSLDEVYYHRDYDKADTFIPSQGWVVFDVGANVGVYTREQARRGASVYAFEPNPDCYRRISQMVSLNSLDSCVRVIHAAVGNAVGIGTLQVEHGWTTSGTVALADCNPAENTVPIPVTTLDAVIPSLAISRIDLLKLDVEGSEADVLRGATNALTIVDRIVVEYHSHALRTQVDDLLLAAGFNQVLRNEENSIAGVGVAYYAKPAVLVAAA